MTLLIIVHILGLVLGIFSSGLLGISLAGGLLQKRVTHARFSTIRRCVEVDIIALVVILVSGIALIGPEGSENGPGNKLWARSILVLVIAGLSVSAKWFVLPMLERNLERPLDGVPNLARNRKFLLSSRVLAFCSWLGLGALGLWRHQSLEALTPLLIVYVALGAFCLVVSPWVRSLRGATGLRTGSGDTRESELHCKDHLSRELERAVHDGETLTVATLHSESLNEVRARYGGMAADQFEKEVNSLIESRLRDVDFSGALGRGKYLLVLPGRDEADSEKVMNRLGRALDEYKFDVSDYAPSPEAESVKVDFTLKVVALKPSAESTPEVVLQELSRAKATLRVLDQA